MQLPQRFLPGMPITAELLDAIVRELWRFRKTQCQAPIDIIGFDGGDEPPIILTTLPPGSPFLLGQTSGSGIPARSSTTPGNASDVTVVVMLSGALTTQTGQTITVYNMSATAVGASKYIIAALIDGLWFSIWEDCG